MTTGWPLWEKRMTEGNSVQLYDIKAEQSRTMKKEEGIYYEDKKTM